MIGIVKSFHKITQGIKVLAHQSFFFLEININYNKFIFFFIKKDMMEKYENYQSFLLKRNCVIVSNL